MREGGREQWPVATEAIKAWKGEGGGEWRGKGRGGGEARGEREG